jgi:formamidopyrimidine-DNA glycosylase
MPELPEVETTRQGILPHCSNEVLKKIIVREHRLRWPIPENLNQYMQNQKILDITRRSKYLLWRFHKGVLLVHLGMSGVLRVLSKFTPPAKHDHVDFELASGKIIRFTDPRRFGAILWTEDASTHPLLTHLGPEPLSAEFTPEYLQKKLMKTTRPIKLALMDASVVVGVGNIYANEALFLSQLHPERSANRLTLKEIMTLVKNIKMTLEKAIKAGGTTLKDFLQSDGRPGYFRHELLVYGRKDQPCLKCAMLLQEIRLSNRSTVFCPQCQT